MGLEFRLFFQLIPLHLVPGYGPSARAAEYSVFNQFEVGSYGLAFGVGDVGSDAV